jgi:LAO/AO transport system kinase
MMKAGILEAANIFVINKADRDGADNLKRELEAMLEMRVALAGAWKPAIILTEAVYNKGTEELAEEILRHKEFLIGSGALEKRKKERAKLELIEAIESSLKGYIYQRIDKGGYLEKVIDDLVQRKTDPHSAASEIINRCIEQFKPTSTL